jgi:predicted small metal-binding protein
MAKQLHCIVDGCDATIEAESEAEVMSQVEAHASSAHPDLELDEETVQTVRDHIQDA